LQAALKLGLRDGYEAVSLLAIATEAKAGRQTIYRWWDSKVVLYLDVLRRELAARESLIAPTDSPTLHSYLISTYSVLEGGFGKLCADLLIDVSRQPSLRETAYQEYIVERRVYVRTLLQALEKAHDQTFSVSIDIVTDMVIGLMWYRLMHQTGPLSVQTAESVYQAAVALLRRSTIET
jgi:AcrR family transcriptional regulator